jgi:uracil-DNA glycosylase
VIDPVADLARRFARTLEQLRTTHDLQYVGTRPLPEPAPADVTAEPHTHAGAPPPQPTTSRPDAASEPRAASSALDSASPASTPEPRAASSSPTPEPAPPRSDPAPGDEEQSRRRALREQAQRWTPAQKLEYLRLHNVGDCQRCPLARTRNRIVFGVGNPEANVMFVGEAPGADEDRQGEPFVGRAGQLLNQWLSQLGLRREDVYIANVLKCRPPGNRDPRPEEVERCSPFLQAQIRAIEPKVIVALGRHAGGLLSGREELTLYSMRQGRLHYDAGASRADPKSRVLIPLVVTYHPAYVLRQEGDGRSPAAPGRASATDMVMTDLRRALAIAQGDAPSR